MNKFQIVEKDGLRRIEYFNEHWYQVGEEFYPSVTQVLQIVAKGVGFDEWLKSVSFNAEHIARKAMESGSKVHNAIEQMIKGNTLSCETGQYEWKEWKMINEFTEWYNGLDVQPLNVENVVYSTELKCAGTVDLVCKIGEKTYLIDYKTGGEYSSHAKQVAAYRYMAEQNGVHIDECAIVYLGSTVRTKKDLNYPGVKVVLVDYEKNIKLFKSALDLWSDENEGAKPKNMEYPVSVGVKNILKVGE
jgi:hypothetical protein